MEQETFFGSNKIMGGSFPAAFLFSHFLSFSFTFSLAKRPSRMITQRMSGKNLFLLEEEGYWQGIHGKLRVFHVLTEVFSIIFKHRF